MPRRFLIVAAALTLVLGLLGHEGRGAQAPAAPFASVETIGVRAAERGLVLAGSVRWPDGCPASGSMSVTSSEPDEDASHMARFDSASFRVCVRPGPHDLDLHAEREGGIGTGHVLRVQPGGAPLELVLEEERTFELTVNAFDPRGEPLADFSADGVLLRLEERAEEDDR